MRRSAGGPQIRMSDYAEGRSLACELSEESSAETTAIERARAKCQYREKTSTGLKISKPQVFIRRPRWDLVFSWSSPHDGAQIEGARAGSLCLSRSSYSGHY